MERVDLAHEAEFRLGPLRVRPGLRQLARDDGAEEVVEPRVMQVLVALARTPGAILSRDDLTTSCWEGRVVGEDAINRVISRLRRAAEAIGEGAFRIETVTKVGYRLILDGAETAPPPAPDQAARAIAELRQIKLDRRAMLIGAGAAVVTVGGGWYLWPRTPAPYKPAPQVAALMQQAMIAVQQGTAEGSNQAIGLLRRVVELDPDYADGWGMLALSYAAASQGRAPQHEADLRARARAAAERARALDPGNVYPALADATLLPRIGNWASVERTVRAGVAAHPDNPLLLSSLAGVLLSVGRCDESADTIDAAVAASPPSPALVYSRVQSLWAANRPEEADRAMDAAFALYPSHFAVWFTRFYLLLYSGRAREALAMSQNREARPTGIPEGNFSSIEVVAQAMISRTPADIDAAIRANIEMAHAGAGFAENALQFASALGRIDTAFEIANGYYFDRGFAVADIRFTEDQRIYTRRANRRSQFLFYPSTQAMRADPRFDALAEELGLTKYWREAGVTPDYRKG